MTGDEHVTDDGVSFHIGGTEIPADQAVLAAGVSGYTFSVDVQGDKSSSGTVRAWLSNRNSNTFPNTLTASRQGPGEFSVDVPAGQVSNPSIRSFLRVDVTSSNNAIEGWHYNTDSPTTMFYAPQRGSEQSKTLDWVIDGEVEDHPIMVANAVARIQFEGVTGDYGVSAPSNTVVTPPSGGAATGTVPADGSPTLLSSHVVANTSNDVEFGVTSMPEGAEIVGEPVLLDHLGNAIVEQHASLDRETMRVTIPAAVFSANPDVTVQIKTVKAVEPSTVVGEKVVGEITWGTLTETVVADDWEIVATDDDEATHVISTGEPLQLEVDKTYMISERLIAEPSAGANLYVQVGPAVCTDTEGGELPAGTFDEESGNLRVSQPGLQVRCTITNAASQISLLNSRIGEGPTTEWGVAGQNENAQFNFDLDDGASSALVRPCGYSLNESLPEGVSLIAFEQLDMTKPACAAAATDVTTAESSCWIKLSTAQRQDFRISAGSHHVLRLVAASVEDMPMLPITGGVGTYAFILASVGFGLLALVAHLMRRHTA